MLNIPKIRRHPAENILKARYPVPAIARYLGICPSYLYAILNGTALPGQALADRLNQLIETINNNPKRVSTTNKPEACEMQARWLQDVTRCCVRARRIRNMTKRSIKDE